MFKYFELEMKQIAHLNDGTTMTLDEALEILNRPRKGVFDEPRMLTLEEQQLLREDKRATQAYYQIMHPNTKKTLKEKFKHSNRKALAGVTKD